MKRHLTIVTVVLFVIMVCLFSASMTNENKKEENTVQSNENNNSGFELQPCMAVNEPEQIVYTNLAYVKKSMKQSEDQVDYYDLMIKAVLDGNAEIGNECEIALNGNISFDDLVLLSKIVMVEAGSDWLTEEHRQFVASVVVNRVNSPEFPNTISEVVYQKGQYQVANTNYFANLIPNEKSVYSAMEILKNGTVLPKEVVFQAEHKQGSGVYQAITDSILGTTYFCYSSYMNLYN